MLAGMPAAGPLVLRLDPDHLDNPTAAAWDDIFRRVHAVETGASAPPPAGPVTEVRRRLAAPEPLRWIGCLRDQIAGLAEARVNPTRSAAYTRVYVDPPHRRRGLGRALLAQVAAGLEGVPTLAATVLVGTPGEHFA